MPWQKSNVHPPLLTFQGYFCQELRPKCPDDCLLCDVTIMVERIMKAACLHQEGCGRMTRNMFITNSGLNKQCCCISEFEQNWQEKCHPPGQNHSLSALFAVTIDWEIFMCKTICSKLFHGVKFS